MDITILSTADWDHPFWTNKQHTAVHLAKLGHRILYVDSTGLRKIVLNNKGDQSRVVRKIKKFFKSPIQVKPNIYVLSPIIIPKHDNYLISLLNSVILATTIRAVLILLNMKREMVWTFNPMSLPTVKMINPQKLIYNNVDDLTAAPGMPCNLQSEEEKLCKSANYIFNTSAELHQRSKRYNSNSYEFTNVADYDHFSTSLKETIPPKDISSIKSPRIGFIGAISPYKLDFDLLNQYANQHKEKNIILIGKLGEGQPEFNSKISAIDNIHLLGPKDYHELPKYLKFLDVLIIPSVKNNYTKSMFPMKFFEYLATEKPIVAKNIDSLKKFSNVFYQYDDYPDFVKAIETALQDGSKNLPLSRELAMKYTWKNRLNKMMNIINN